MTMYAPPIIMNANMVSLFVDGAHISPIHLWFVTNFVVFSQFSIMIAFTNGCLRMKTALAAAGCT